MHQVVAGVVGDLDQHPQARQLGVHLVDAGREAGVIEQRGRTGVREQVLQLVLHIAVVDVERRHPRPPCAEHPLDVFGPVVGVEAEQVLADLVTGQLGAFGVAAQPARVQIGREPVGPLVDLRKGVAAVALDDELAVTDRRGDGLRGGGDGELHCGGGHRISVDLSQGWCGSSLTIRPFASDSTVPSASVIVAVMNALRPSIRSIRPRATRGSSIGVTNL